jgi:hypothetical protein
MFLKKQTKEGKNMKPKITIHTFQNQQELFDHISGLGAVEFHSFQLITGDYKRERIKNEGNFKVDKITIKTYAIVEELANKSDDSDNSYELYIKQNIEMPQELIDWFQKI